MTLREVLFAVALGTALLSMPVPEVKAQRRCPDGTTVGGGQTCGPLTATARNEGKASRLVRPRSFSVIERTRMQKSESPARATTKTAITQAESRKNMALKAKRAGTGAQAGNGRAQIECEGYTYMGQATLATPCAGK